MIETTITLSLIEARLIMKKITLTNLIATLSFSIIFSGCLLIPKTNSTDILPTTTSINGENTPEFVPTKEELSYEFLSPTIITNKAQTMKFEVSAFLSKPTFSFRVDAFLPPEFEFAYPDYIYPNIYDSVELSFTPDIEYQAMGGGGGSGLLENTFNINSQSDHSVLSQISSGQQFNLRAVVDFGEFTEITELVTFEILLIIQE